MIHPLEIGRVVKSNDHTDYVVHIFAAGDIARPPRPEEYGFGQFVRIPVDDTNALIGVIYTTQLVNPDYGALGPRLSPESELQVFSPDYLTEKATLVGVAIVGSEARGPEGVRYQQETPQLAASVDASVELLDAARVTAFHQAGTALRLAYFPRLLAQPSPILPDLLCAILDRLTPEAPEQKAALRVLRMNIRWRAIMPGR